MKKSHPKMNKERAWKKVMIAILPGLIVAGLIFAANTYYDLDVGKIIVNEVQRVLQTLEAERISVFGTSGNTLTVDGDVLVVDATNNRVGIGTTSPSQKLTVAGGGIKLDNNQPLYWLRDGTDVDILLLSGWTTLLRGGGGTPTLNIQTTGGSNIMSFLENGNVGIGTPSPALKLDVSGSARIYDQTATTGVSTLTIRAGEGQATAPLFQWQNNAGTVLGVIDSSGNVGIGTTSPVQKLHVEGQCVTGDTEIYTVPSGFDEGLGVQGSRLKVQGKQIKDLQPGDYVYSYNEETQKVEAHKVKALLDMGVKPVFKLTTESGKSIRTTGNHPYYAIKKGNKNYEEVATRRLRGLAISNQIDPDSIQIDREISQGRTLWLDRSTEESSSLNSQFNRRGQRSLFSELLSRISLQSQGKPLRDSDLPDHSRKAGLSNLAGQKGGNQFSLYHPEQVSRTNQLNQEADWIKVIFLEEGDLIATASLEPSTSNLERYVVWDKIKSIEFVGYEQVYDISVEGTYNFFGNGILAHNTYLSGNVGIGTTAPTSKLDVAGTAQLRGAAGGTGLYVDSNGNVGINTTLPGPYALNVSGQCVTGDTRLRRRRRRKSEIRNPKSENDYEYDEVMIKDIQPGDEIQTLDENTGKLVWSKVNALMDMGQKTTYRLKTADGREIRTTENHPYLVKEVGKRPQKHSSPISGAGWLTVSHIKPGDYIATPKPKAGVFIDDANMFYAQKRMGWRVDYRRLKEILSQDFDVRFMNYYLAIPKPTDQPAFYKAQRFLSKLGYKDDLTETFELHPLEFTKFWQRLKGDEMNIITKPLKYIPEKIHFGDGTIIDRVNKKGDVDVDITIDVLDSLENLDVVIVLSGDSDFVKLRKEVLRKGKKIIFLSSNNNLAVELRQGKFFTLEKLRKFIELGSENQKAPDTFRGTLLSLLYSNQEVLSSGDNSDFVWAKVSAIEKVGEEKVYDIEVEGTHNFIGNDIVAHNTYISATTTI